MSNIAIIILAAGNSSRMGRPKQLLVFNGITLLENVIKQSIDTGLGPVLVVLGSNAGDIKARHHHLDAEFAWNKDWITGMGSSVAIGIERAFQISADLDGVILAVGDQPYFSKEILLKLAQASEESGMPIVASRYGDVLGSPTYFGKDFFPLLTQIKGDKGAREIIYGNKDCLASIPFELGAIDIDTWNDYNSLKENQKF